MIDLFDEEQVRLIIEHRRNSYVLGKDFWILTPLNHLFGFDADGDISLRKISNILRLIYSPETISSYGLEYTGDNRSPYLYISTSEQIETFYETCISNPEYMFFDWNEIKALETELQHRGLI